MVIYISAQSSKSVSFFNTDRSLIAAIVSGGNFIPYKTNGTPSFSHKFRVPALGAWRSITRYHRRKGREKGTLTHSVNNNPGNTAFTLTFSPCVNANPRIRCSCAAFVTLYAMELPAKLVPATLLVMIMTPP
jgi:hypothetical protein